MGGGGTKKKKTFKICPSLAFPGHFVFVVVAAAVIRLFMSVRFSRIDHCKSSLDSVYPVVPVRRIVLPRRFFFIMGEELNGAGGHQ